MSTTKKILIGILIIIGLIGYILVFNLTKKDNDKKDEELTPTPTPQVELSDPNIIQPTDEIKNSNILDKKLQINGVVIEMPIKLKDFLEKTNMKLSEKYKSDVDLSINLRTKEEVTCYFTTDDYSIIIVDIINSNNVIKKIEDCYIYSVNIAETTNEITNKANLGLIYTFGGIGYEHNISNYEELLSSIEWDENYSKQINNKIAKYFKKDNVIIIYFYDEETKNIKEIYYEIEQENEEN